ncbi:MAG: bifunctional phosphoribosylaminoimidazolecarboxamide formyltransferase/IMP cyclohydrolase PurH [Proteobacteria bacterium]|nr:MAG: bifunctional phosphoribosylaminoimidazolecarboxamide formyltransferase/IMP cyclohydrolase PurH [Pseudomonadota bacterium]
MQRYAIVSVSDRSKLVEFAAGLIRKGFALLTTSGTGRFLADHKLESLSIEQYSGQSEILGGRVKTLHPKIFAGILARRDNPQDLEQLKDQGIHLIDVVAVNLYPFSKELGQDHTLEEMIELIDIGGPSLIRAAAKNYHSVFPVIDPGDYGSVLDQLGADAQIEQGQQFRKNLACKVFAQLALDNIDVVSYLSSESYSAPLKINMDFPLISGLMYTKGQDLRYGENPHQRAAYYLAMEKGSRRCWKQRWGKELSFNNILDFDACARLLNALPKDLPSAVIMKHLNPCGAARAATLKEALRLSKLADPRSHFGGILGFTREVDAESAELIREDFAELVVAPGYSEQALEILKTSRNLRILELELDYRPTPLEIRSVLDGYLIQESDISYSEVSQANQVSKRTPSGRESADLAFSWGLCSHVKSNAICLVKDGTLIGVGAGQMSRIDSVELAIHKARYHGHDLKGAVAASDAFFPFSDSLECLAEAGVTAVIAPAGAKKDQEVIECADKHALALLFAADRHFRH